MNRERYAVAGQRCADCGESVDVRAVPNVLAPTDAVELHVAQASDADGAGGPCPVAGGAPTSAVRTS